MATMVAGISRAEALFLVQSGACYICGEPMAWTPGKFIQRFDAATKDHILPRAKKHRAAKGNVALAHFSYNQQKGHSPISLEAMERGREYSMLAFDIVQRASGNFGSLKDWEQRT